jgi:LmbE family N-acetylglucosaminyl deacetylase
MNQLEIALIIIGIIVIIVSCVIVDKSQKLQQQMIGKSLAQVEDKLGEEDRKQLLDKLKELLAEVREEAIQQTDDTLSKISNEKIMAVNEFSDQIMEKIKRNHEEVVFLYNMLNDKEKELKLTVREIDSSKKKVQDILNSKAEGDKLQAVKNEKTQAAAKAISQERNPQDTKQVKQGARPSEASTQLSTISGPNSNSNSQILALYSQGRSVVEISKLLGLGQGEVKLVIDLYKGKK